MRLVYELGGIDFRFNMEIVSLGLGKECLLYYTEAMSLQRVSRRAFEMGAHITSNAEDRRGYDSISPSYRFSNN